MLKASEEGGFPSAPAEVNLRGCVHWAELRANGWLAGGLRRSN